MDGTACGISARAPYRRSFRGRTRRAPGGQLQAADGWTIHGQLFDNGSGTRKPAVIFVHGGPPRQMLLGWHYMDYYTNATR